MICKEHHPNGKRRKVMRTEGEKGRGKEEGKQLRLKGQGERWFSSVYMEVNLNPAFYSIPLAPCRLCVC